MGREGSWAFYSHPIGFKDRFTHHDGADCLESAASQHDEHGKTGNGRLELIISWANGCLHPQNEVWAAGFVMKDCTLEPESFLPSPCHLVTEGRLVSQCANYGGAPPAPRSCHVFCWGPFGCGRQPDIYLFNCSKVAMPRLNLIKQNGSDAVRLICS